jgi:hypothetical protein
MKANQSFYTERYELEHRQEENGVFKLIDIWYIKDVTKKKYGKYVAKFWVKSLAELSLEYLNHKKKLRKRKVRNG